MDALVEKSGSKERSPRVSTRFSLNVENERGEAGRDRQTRLARPNFQPRKGIGKKTSSLFSWPRAGLVATIPRLINFLLKVLTKNTYDMAIDINVDLAASP